MRSLVTLLLLTGLAGFQSPLTESRIAGTWEGRANDLPAVTINIEQLDGKVSGAVVFYFQTRRTGTWRVERESREPMLEPKFDGETLTFQVSHEFAHPGESGPNDSPIPFKFTITGRNKARLRITDRENPEVPLVRVK